MKSTLFWLVILYLGKANIATAQIVDQGKYDLQFALVEQREDTLFVDLKIRSAIENESFKVGSHTIFFDYNKLGIKCIGYKPANFHGGQEACHEMAYPQRSFTPNHHLGAANLTATANQAFLENVCPIVTNDWLSFGRLTFLKLQEEDIALTFNPFKTILNYIDTSTDSPKDTAAHIQQIPFTGVTEVPTALNLQLKAFLSGAYQSGSMKTELRNKELIPLTQPYNQSPWNYNGDESVANITDMPTNTVDWVLVEIRDDKTSSASTILQKAALLLADGSIVDANNPTLNSIDISSLSANTDYYIVIKHRNHLPVMSALPINLSSSSLTTYDFSTGIDKAWKNDGLENEAMKLENNVSLFWAGNANLNIDIRYNNSQNDKNTILAKVGLNTPSNVIQGYENADLNLDGLVKYNGGNNDKNVILKTVGLATPSNIIVQHLP